MTKWYPHTHTPPLPPIRFKSAEEPLSGLLFAVSVSTWQIERVRGSTSVPDLAVLVLELEALAYEMQLRDRAAARCVAGTLMCSIPSPTPPPTSLPLCNCPVALS